MLFYHFSIYHGVQYTRIPPKKNTCTHRIPPEYLPTTPVSVVEREMRGMIWTQSPMFWLWPGCLVGKHKLFIDTLSPKILDFIVINVLSHTRLRSQSQTVIKPTDVFGITYSEGPILSSQELVVRSQEARNGGYSSRCSEI